MDKIIYLSLLVALLGANLVISDFQQQTVEDEEDEVRAKKEFKELVNKVYSTDRNLRLNDILGYLKQADHVYKKLVSSGSNTGELVEVASQVSDLIGVREFVGEDCRPETFKKLDTMLEMHIDRAVHIVPYLKKQYDNHFKACIVRYIDILKNEVLSLEPEMSRAGHELWHSIATAKNAESVAKFHRLVPEKTLITGLRAFVESMNGPVRTASSGDKKEFMEAFGKFVVQTCQEIDDVLDRTFNEFDVIVKSRSAAREMDEFTTAWTNTELVCKIILNDKFKLSELVYNFNRLQHAAPANPPKKNSGFLSFFKRSKN